MKLMMTKNLVSYENQKTLHDTYLKQLEQQFLKSQIDIQKIKNDDKIVDHENVQCLPINTKNEDEKNDNPLEYKCNKCSNILSSNRSLKRHLINCKGVHTLQCPSCLKEFTTAQGKWNHMNYVTCIPVNPHYQNNDKTN